MEGRSALVEVLVVGDVVVSEEVVREFRDESPKVYESERHALDYFYLSYHVATFM